jgi:nucleoside-diphosphate-sugar epimerase
VATAAEGCDVIYHLAAAQRMKPQFNAWSEQQVFDRNLAGVEAVIRVAERIGARKVIHISSSGIYGLPRSNPCGEDHPQEPLGDYGHSKIAAETLCREAADRGLDITWFRPMTLFGPEMSGLFVMIFEWVRTGSPVFLLGRGENRVQTTSAWDVVDACLAATDHPRTRGEFYNLGAEPSAVPTVEEMMQGLIDHAGTGSRILKIPAALLRNTARALNLVGLSPIVREHYTLADADFVLDIHKAKEGFGFAPRFTNTQMICDAYDWYVGEGEAVRPPPHPMLKLLSVFFPGKAG